MHGRFGLTASRAGVATPCVADGVADGVAEADGDPLVERVGSGVVRPAEEEAAEHAASRTSAAAAAAAHQPRRRLTS
jgi:hypothetical protein